MKGNEMLARRVSVLFGTETGNAELVADEIADVLEACAEAVQVSDMNDYSPSSLAENDVVVVVCSTYGEGDLPASAQPFFDALTADQPSLSGVRVAVFGLGDSSYNTFNNGSQILSSQMASLGADRIGEHGVHDASSAADLAGTARDWAEKIIDEISMNSGPLADPIASLERSVKV